MGTSIVPLLIIVLVNDFDAEMKMFLYVFVPAFKNRRHVFERLRILFPFQIETFMNMHGRKLMILLVSNDLYI